MKKCLFIFTLVFALLLSCSGSGLVAYADSDTYINSEFAYNPETFTVSGNGIEYVFKDTVIDRISNSDNYTVAYSNRNTEVDIYIFTYSDEYCLGVKVSSYFLLDSNLSAKYESDVDFSSVAHCDCFTFAGADYLTYKSEEFTLATEVPTLASYLTAYFYLGGTGGQNTLYSSKDIYQLYYDSENKIYYTDGTYFFHLPQQVLGMEKEVLARVMTQENPLKEVLILLPMAMVCLVGFVGLRKALALLQQILHQA